MCAYSTSSTTAPLNIARHLPTGVSSTSSTAAPLIKATHLPTRLLTVAL